MKKFIIIILLILPIFLMVTVSLVGQMLATITVINVESIMFVDESKNEIDSIKIGKNQTKKLLFQILPELSTNKRVKFNSLDEDIATIDNSGNLFGVEYGYATIIVETIDGKKTDRITINVTDESVAGVDIELSEKTMYLYAKSKQLLHSVYPNTAKDKRVTWSSSHPEYVFVNEETGEITAKKVTEPGMTVTITVTTRDGSFTDTCEITVLPYLLVFLPQINNPNATYIHNSLTLDLMSFITYDASKISEDEISFYFDREEETYATIADNVLTFNPEYEGELIKLVCSVKNDEVDAEIKIIIMYESK